MGKKVKVQITILQGRGLAPKDRNLLGRRTTSDPYVEVWANDPTTKEDKLAGKTPVILKTLNPTWTVDNHFVTKLLGPKPKLVFKIWDQDLLTAPDLMGIVTVPISTKKTDSTRWYEVPKDSARNAQGQLLLRVQTVGLKAKKKTKKAGTVTKEKNKERGTSPMRANKTAPDDEDDWGFGEEEDFSADEDEFDIVDKDVVLPKLIVHDCSEEPSPEARKTEIEAQSRIQKLQKEITRLKDEIAGADPYNDPKEQAMANFKGRKSQAERAASRNSVLPMVEYLQAENRRLQRETDELIQRIEDELDRDLATSEQMKVQMTIVRGSGLAAKDRNVLGQRTTSDPYCEVLNSNSKLLGRTRTIEKTLNPVWNERFDMEVRLSKAVVIVRIWDEDYMSEPDAMGTIRLMVPTQPGETVEWYQVPTYSAKNACGRVQIRFHVEMIPDPRWEVDRLEKQVERLTQELETTRLETPEEDQNCLQPTMQFLKAKNKELLVLKQKLEQQLQYNM